MTVAALIRDAISALKDSDIQDPAYEAGLLLSWLLKKSMGYVYAHAEDTVSNDKVIEYENLINRRQGGEPVQYIMGECGFMSLRFMVNPSVLIPRCDTELLAEAALYALGGEVPLFSQDMFSLARKSKVRLLDIGTGSGCLAVCLAKMSPDIHVDAMDISLEAINVAKQNAVMHGAENNIRFIHADFLNGGFSEEPYHIIISNPPYIAREETADLHRTVRDFEPSLALFADDNGLSFYRKIAGEAGNLLDSEGIILVECGYSQAARIKSIFSEAGLETKGLFDLSGIERVIAARFKK